MLVLGFCVFVLKAARMLVPVVVSRVRIELPYLLFSFHDLMELWRWYVYLEFTHILGSCTEFLICHNLSNTELFGLHYKLLLFFCHLVWISNYGYCLGSGRTSFRLILAVRMDCFSSSCFPHGLCPTSSVVNLNSTHTTIDKCTTIHATLASFTINTNINANTSSPCHFSSTLTH